MTDQGPSPIVSTVLLALQFCLGVWQIVKLTPVGIIINCLVKRWLFSPFGLSTAYARLNQFEGHLYKQVRCHVLLRPGTLVAADHKSNPQSQSLSARYLGEEFLLERRSTNMLLDVYRPDISTRKGEEAKHHLCYYYITDTIWLCLEEMARVSSNTVFLKGYKEFWQQVASGGVMSFEQVLDSMILDNMTIMELDNHLLLPVDSSVSEEKLLKFLNLAGLFLQTKQVSWIYPTCLSLTSAVLEFMTPMRVRLYNKLNRLFCCLVQCLVDNLPRRARRHAYALGSWVENLRPSNDMELKIVRRSKVWVVIGGGAKIKMQAHDQYPSLQCALEKDTMEFKEQDLEGRVIAGTTLKWACSAILPTGRGVWATFLSNENKCHIGANAISHATISCTQDHLENLKIFLSCVAHRHIGSLRTLELSASNLFANKPINVVTVRPFRESVLCYSRNGFPHVYELCLKNVNVT